MLERIKDLPPELEGLRAVGRISRDDYDTVVQPLLERAKQDGRRIRFLYEIGPAYDGFTAGGAWEDTRLGLRYLQVFEACAVVSDIGWIRELTRVLAFVLPCPVRVFASDDRDEAVRWLASFDQERAAAHRLIPSRGVLVLEVERPLRASDFDALASTADAWIREHGRLSGLVVHAREFPGWENFAGLVRHLRFVREHHRVIERVALAADSRLASLGPRIAEHFVAAEVRHFAYDEIDAAIEWASQETARPRAVAGGER